MAVFPCRRQGRQQLDFSVMALQKHLSDTRCAAEVAVDLERRMGAEKVGISTSMMSAYAVNGRLQKVFQEMDVNNDGMLTYSEIKNAYEKYFGKTISEIQINKIIEGMDSNSDGIISYEEFLRVSLNQNHFVDEKNLKLAFDLFDLNKDGKLSKGYRRKIRPPLKYLLIDKLRHTTH